MNENNSTNFHWIYFKASTEAFMTQFSNQPQGEPFLIFPSFFQPKMINKRKSFPSLRIPFFSATRADFSCEIKFCMNVGLERVTREDTFPLEKISFSTRTRKARKSMSEGAKLLMLGDGKWALCKWWKCKLLIMHDVHASPSNLAQSRRLRLTANSSTNF